MKEESTRWESHLFHFRTLETEENRCERRQILFSNPPFFHFRSIDRRPWDSFGARP